MAVSLAQYCAAVFVGTLLAGLAYRRAWLRLQPTERVPTGFGALLAVVLLGVALVAGSRREIIAPLVIMTAATVIYWFDDARELSARFRLAIAFVSGALVGAGYIVGDGAQPILFVALTIAMSGFLGVVLTNTVNFYDGADLNLATFIALTALVLLLFVPMGGDWGALAAASLAFVVPFGMMNRLPRMIYLGDSGSFAFAGMLTLMTVAFVADPANLPPEAFIPAALPLLDVAYVFTVRLWERHDLLSRNYMHLYQRLNRRYAGFGYLVPQLLNLLLCLACAWLLQVAGLGRIASVLLAAFGVTPPFYFLCRRLFLSGPVEGPLQERRS